MATNTAEAFNEFYERIKPSASVLQKAADRRSSVEASLARAFPATSDLRYKQSWLIGSLGRRTASKPLADMDLMVHIHVDQALWERSYKSDSSRFLYRVRESINGASAVQKIGARGQAIRLFYSDDFVVDVAAVEQYTSGDFAIPDGTGGWQTTNPIKHANHLQERDDLVSGDLRRFVQIAKQWNRAHSARLHSFHFEMLAANTFSSLNNDRRDALEVFFKQAARGVSVNDPAGLSGDLSSYLTFNQRLQVTSTLTSAAEQAERANAAEARGDHREAIRLWRLILGDDFPAYG